MSARATVVRLGKQSQVTESNAIYERRKQRWAWEQVDQRTTEMAKNGQPYPNYKVIDEYLAQYQAQYEAEQPRRKYDKLVVANTPMGPTIFHRGDYNDGDLVVFIPSGAILPEKTSSFTTLFGNRVLVQNDAKNAKWNWLRFKDGWHRIKPIRFAGVPSHGMVIPADADMVEGQDVSERLGILYDE